ncbi:hypothetical protein DLAC_11824 [Tieghemostelium lacteum]|uniref:Tenascin X n=1 Tax=Tieghemostelium lacteum TaxID=361077 RepID=A0A151Z455_TIELA|nr:hypothetical protein DLAC_11824 [Tieghemostelium lacteum]|eukprot:KYQ88697.1 hypothetical protein DLAC_11824 [Tieghemostelium lacteum]
MVSPTYSTYLSVWKFNDNFGVINIENAYCKLGPYTCKMDKDSQCSITIYTTSPNKNETCLSEWSVYGVTDINNNERSLSNLDLPMFNIVSQNPDSYSIEPHESSLTHPNLPLLQHCSLISINIGFPSSESLLNDTNSYGLEIYAEFRTGGFDFNGDGKQDFMVSHSITKKIYVFFGDISRYGDQRPLKVSMIDGINGFSINIPKIQIRNYFLCGDINNDGYDEIIIRVLNGQLKIIYGHAGPFKNDFSNFDGIEGFVIDYVYTLDSRFASYQVICDHNGDGINDLIFNTLDDVVVLYGLDNGKKFPTNSGIFDFNFVSNGTLGHILQNKNSINLGCGDLNNDGIDDIVILSDTDTGIVSFGLKIYPTIYNPLLNGKNGFTMKMKANSFEYVLQIGFGDFNGDGLQDMAVVTYDSKSIYMIYGKKDGIWESHFDINSGNSSEVVKWVRNVSSPEKLCTSMYFGDINGDGISDLSCNDDKNEITWGV